jgi:hypothetical protein
MATHQKHRTNRTGEATLKRRTARPVNRVPAAVRQPVDLSALQRMETYDGVTVLATNLRANLDEAFTRRRRFTVDLPFPEEADRLRIWQTLFPPDVSRAPDLDFGFLARRFKLAGAISQILSRAADLAAHEGACLTKQYLLPAAWPARRKHTSK